MGRITLKVQRDGRRLTVDVVPDGGGLVSHAGVSLVAGAADRLGLTAALSRGLVIRRAVLELGQTAWRPAIRQDGEEREGARVAEITDRLELTGWPRAAA